MSDDIRVYWERDKDKYYIFIGEYSTLTQWGSDCSVCNDVDFNESSVGSQLPLVYDSAEHEDYSLIDANLVIPKCIRDLVWDKDNGWSTFDCNIYCEGVERHLQYHEERTA